MKYYFPVYTIPEEGSPIGVGLPLSFFRLNSVAHRGNRRQDHRPVPPVYRQKSYPQSHDHIRFVALLYRSLSTVDRI